MAAVKERGDRAHEARGATRRVPLTRGMEATVDAADYHLVGMHRWQAFPSSGGRSFHARRQFRVPGTDRKATITMSHVILGVGPERAVRHLNGDTLDCRRSNLVEVARRGLGPVDPNTGRRLELPGASSRKHRDPLDEEYQG